MISVCRDHVSTPNGGRGAPRRIALAPLGMLALMGLAGCDREPKAIPKPVFYRELASENAEVDAGSAREIFSAYRATLGLPPLALDPALMGEARRKADSLAKAGTIADGSGSSSDSGAARQEIVSAGYYTISDAFSGWRGSPVHDRKLRTPKATRMGIATAYAPASKYKIYWVVILTP